MINFFQSGQLPIASNNQDEIEKNLRLASFAERSNESAPEFSRRCFVGLRLSAAFIAITTIICFVKPAWAAVEITHSCHAGSDSANLNLALKGEITQSDVDALQRRLDMLTVKHPSAQGYGSLITGPDGPLTCSAKRVYVGATLNSPGGSVDAAIRIGEIIRSANGNVVVQAGAVCYSACVLVLAAGPRRHIESTAKIGIHRPYFRNTLSVSDESLEETYQKLTVRIENFLNSSGVRPQLASEMMRIPPEQVRVLTRAELDEYGLGTNNIAVQEGDAMREAEKYGVSRQELVRRRQNALRNCGPSPCQDKANIDACFMWTVCKDTIMSNSDRR